MEVPITQFRRDIFALMNRAAHGEQLSVTYKGERFLIIPETAPKTRFDRLTPMQIINPDYPGTFADAKKQIMEEMEKAWEEDWADL